MNSSIGRYKHYKGNIYNVIGEAIHTETEEIMIVYKNKKNEMFVRPRSVFMEKVEVNGEYVLRFKKINK